MSNDPSRVELVLHHDHRLLAAVGAVVAYAGERAGLSLGAQQALSHAAAEACEEAFSLAGRNGNPDPVVKVAVSDFPDRVEVAIEHVGEPCANRPRPNVDRVGVRRSRREVANHLGQVLRRLKVRTESLAGHPRFQLSISNPISNPRFPSASYICTVNI